MGTISITKIASLLNNLQSSGINSRDILNASGINLSVLDSPDNRLPSEKIDKIFREALRLTGNENFGLHCGKNISRGFSNIIWYVLLHCPDLITAANKYIKYERLIDTTCVTSMNINVDTLVIKVEVTDHLLADNRQYCDYKLSGMLSYLRLLIGQDFSVK